MEGGSSMKRKAAAAAFALCFAVPLLALVVQSFAAKWPFGEIWPLAWTLDGWRVPFSDPLLAEAWGRTILIANATTISRIVTITRKGCANGAVNSLQRLPTGTKNGLPRNCHASLSP